MWEKENARGGAPGSPPGGRDLEKFPPYSVPTMKESRESCEMMDPRESRAARSILAPDCPRLALPELRGFSPPGRRPALVPRSFATASFCSADIGPLFTWHDKIYGWSGGAEPSSSHPRRRRWALHLERNEC